MQYIKRKELSLEEERELLRKQYELLLADFKKLFFICQIDYISNKDHQWVTFYSMLEREYESLDTVKNRNLLQAYHGRIERIRPVLDKALAMRKIEGKLL